MREETVSINGVLYNARTGQPIKKILSPKPPGQKTASSFATNTNQKQTKKVLVRQPKKIFVGQTSKPIAGRKTIPSKTLNRQFVKKPGFAKRVIDSIQTPKKATIQRPITQSVTKKTPIATPSKIAYRGIKRPKPASDHRSTEQTNQRPTKSSKSTEAKKKKRLITIITGSVVLVAIIGAVLSYFFLPSVSVWVASGRAGVNATLPAYAPSGYKVSGTAESSPGIVTINYYSKGVHSSYSITQSNSNWDSAGVLENKVKPLSNSYQTLSQKGLTIYRYSTGAIWVNGGILYTIIDEGKLSNEQILYIVDGI